MLKTATDLPRVLGSAATAFALSAAVVPLWGSGIAAAATVSECGPSICYEYDDQQDALEWFGAPTLVGDEMRFLPGNFVAQSLDGTTGLVSAVFVFDRVYTQSGANFDSINIREIGDYEISNGGPDAAVSGDLFVLAASNVNPLDCQCGVTDSFDASGDSGGIQLWEMNAEVTPSAVFTGVANDIALSIQNTLTASTVDTDLSDVAWIQKKFVITGSVIPLPPALWLFGSAVAGLGWLRRRKSS